MAVLLDVARGKGRGRELPCLECFGSPEIPTLKGDSVYRDRTFMNDISHLIKGGYPHLVCQVRIQQDCSLKAKK